MRGISVGVTCGVRTGGGLQQEQEGAVTLGGDGDDDCGGGDCHIPCPTPRMCLSADLGGGSATHLWRVCAHVCVTRPFRSMCGCSTYVCILHNGMFSKTTEWTEYYNQKLGTHPSKIRANIPSHLLNFPRPKTFGSNVERERTSGSLLALKDTWMRIGQGSSW